MKYYELDKLQCQAMTQLKKRCVRIATHHNGGKLLCENHHQMAMAKKKEEKSNEARR